MIIDILLVIFAATGFWLGYTRGIVGTLFSIVSYVIALLLTLAFSPWFVEFLIKGFKMNPTLALILGTISFLFLMMFLIRLAFKRVEKYLNKGKLNTFNKISAGILMMFLSILIFSFLLLPIIQFKVLGEKTLQSSVSLPSLEVISQKTRNVIEELKPLFRRYWDLMQRANEQQNTEVNQ
jgi:membrane protein required for colicin V production